MHLTAERLELTIPRRGASERQPRSARRSSSTDEAVASELSSVMGDQTRHCRPQWCYHGPGTEIYLSGRYFTVTEQLWPGQPDKIVMLDWRQLERLAQLIPAPAGNGKIQASSNRAGRDISRSAKALREGARRRREGNTFEDMCWALRQHPDPDIRDWVREKGEICDQRELHRIWDIAGPPRSDVGLDDFYRSPSASTKIERKSSYPQLPGLIETGRSNR
jgi:hypothetical protein